MIQSKAWDWSKVTNTVKWLEPSEDSYYLLYKWTEKNFKRVLDLGCGLGRHSILFASNGFKVDSFDLAQNALDRLQETIDGTDLDITLTHGDMINLPYEDQCFDGILAYHSIGHTDSEGIKKVVSEIHRVLKPNGEILLTLPSKSGGAFTDPKNKVIDKNTIVPTEGQEEGIPHFYAAHDEIEELLVGFEVLKIRGLEYFNPEGSTRHLYVLARRL